MKLQTKVALILASAWVIISLIIYADSKLVLQSGYFKLENELIIKDIHNTKNAYNRMLQGLALYTVAWADWDDAYYFMQDKNKKFIQSNFVPGTFTTSKINFFLFFDVKGNYFYGQAYDFAQDKIVPVPKSLLSYLSDKKMFLSHDTLSSQKTGLLKTRGGLVVMASLPVLTGDAKGPSQGSLLMGYYLKNDHIQDLSKTVNMNIQFYSLPLKSNNKIVRSAYAALNAGAKEYVSTVNAKVATGYIFLNDIDNKPVAMLQIEIPRLVYQQGILTINHYLIIIITMGIFTLILMWYLLKLFVLDRVISVSKQVAEINKSNKFDSQFMISGNDEIADMVASVNYMMRLISLSQNQLHYLAHHDLLTSLPNRSLFYEILSAEIAKARPYQSQLAVMFMDIDSFKQVNDTYDHAVGDELLKWVAKTLENIVNGKGRVARLSGDEFIACLSNIEPVNSVSETAKNMLEKVSQPIEINGHLIRVTLSVGISLYPKDASDIEGLLRCADHAMYYAKKQQGNAYYYYDAKMEGVH